MTRIKKARPFCIEQPMVADSGVFSSADNQAIARGRGTSSQAVSRPDAHGIQSAVAANKLMATPEETVGPQEGSASCEEPLEVFWQLRSRSGWVLHCAIFQTETGLALRVCPERDNPISTTPVKSLEEGRTRAAKLRQILLEDGEFEVIGEAT